MFISFPHLVDSLSPWRIRVSWLNDALFERLRYRFLHSPCVYTRLKAANYYMSPRLFNKCLVIRRSNRRSELAIPLITPCSCGREGASHSILDLTREMAPDRENKILQRCVMDIHCLIIFSTLLWETHNFPIICFSRQPPGNTIIFCNGRSLPMTAEGQ